MSGFRASLKKDIRLALARPVIFAFVATFALGAGALTFYPGHFFDANRADLTTLFVFLPWLLALLTPALAMEALSAERRAGTAELLFALPLNAAQVVIAKAVSMWLICMVALIATMSLWISVSWLGHPDHGSIIAGYLGLALLAAAFCALSLAASASTSSQALAFLGALTANIVLMLGALPLVRNLPKPLASALEDFSVPVHQSHFLRGVISLNDVIFFISLVAFGLMVACALWRRTRWSLIVLAFIVLLAINSAANFQVVRALRLDLSAGQLYTLSPAAKQIIKRQTTPVQWTFYYSRALARRYPDIRSFGAQIEESLRSFSDASKGVIRLNSIDPGVDNPKEDAALALGLQALPTDTGQPLYLGLASPDGALIARFNPQRATSLEYDLARALNSSTASRQTIALYDGIDLSGQDWFVTGRKESLIFSLLKQRFKVELLPADFTLDDLEGRILMVVHPPAFASQQDQAISNFIANGGRAMVFLDAYSEASTRPALNGLPRPDARMASVAPGFLLATRLGWSSTKIVLDGDAAMPVERVTNTYRRMVRQPAWMGISPARLSPQNPVTSHLQRGLVLASSARLWGDKNTGWQPLIHTGEHSALYAASAFAADPDPDALMELVKTKAEPYWLAAYRAGVIVLGDADLLDDDFYVETDPVFGKRAKADNADFVLNALDWLGGSNALLRLRSRQALPQTLTRIDALRTRAEVQLRDAQTKAGAQPDAKAALRLRAIRHGFHSQIKRLEHLLEAFNIWLAPALIVLLGGALTLWRRRRAL
jgi:gliding motility-associatede transport system auxiliary component